jgi:hypothetical protein
MRTEADLMALCNEFTNALTSGGERGWLGATRSRAHAAVKSTLNIMTMYFAWQWRRRSLSGKHCKMSVTNAEASHSSRFA